MSITIQLVSKYSEVLIAVQLPNSEFVNCHELNKVFAVQSTNLTVMRLKPTLECYLIFVMFVICV